MWCVHEELFFFFREYLGIPQEGFSYLNFFFSVAAHAYSYQKYENIVCIKTVKKDN